MPETYPTYSRYCDDCLGTFSRSDAYATDQAYEDHFWFCDNCDSDHCGNTYSECPSYESNDDLGIHDYSYRPCLVFHGTGDYYLGIELEISADDYASAHPIYQWATANGHDGLFYVKEDGSVEGFEIVSHPMSPDFFESVDWDAFFVMINAQYPRRQSDEREGHGLHVHVSRTAFHTPLALARWSMLLNRNAEHIARIARRTSTQWADFSPSPVSDVLATDTRLVKRLEGRPGARIPIYCTCDACATSEAPRLDRYDTAPPPPYFRARTLRNPPRYRATNMQNSETVEVRVFRSTRRAAELLDSVRTVISSVEFVRSMQPWHTCKTCDLVTWARFVEFVADRFPAFYPTAAGIPVAA